MALVDQHTTSLSKSKDRDKEPCIIWDHTCAMGLGGRLMDDDKRSKRRKDWVIGSGVGVEEGFCSMEVMLAGRDDWTD